jgi:outer membrane protein assembly factor BamB
MGTGRHLLTSLLAATVPFIGSALADWPGWRGPNRDGRASETLPKVLPAESKPVWKLAIGRGYSGPVVAGNTLVYVDEQQGSETAHALDRATGRELWKTAYAKAWSDEFEPGPRCTPLLDGELAYVQSAQGVVACLSVTNGQKLWSIDFKDLGMTWVTERHANVGAAVRRGHTGSPVIDGDRIFLQTSALAGKSIVALDKRTGKTLWQALDDQTAYSSPVVATLAGRRQFVTATCEGLVGLDVSSGAELWRTRFQTGANRNVLTPIIVGDDVLFASHTTGLRCQRITSGEKTQTSTERWLNRQLRINMPTPVAVGRQLYGVGPSRDFVCVDLEDGLPRWTERGFGEVANVITDGAVLLVQLDSGEVRLLAANNVRYEELGRFQACGKTYSHPALQAGVLYTRDPQSLTAWPLTAKP